MTDQDRARAVRQALVSVAADLGTSRIDSKVFIAIVRVASMADDATLARLGRCLKHV